MARKCRRRRPKACAPPLKTGSPASKWRSTAAGNLCTTTFSAWNRWSGVVAGSVPVERLAGVGARRAQQLKQLGIHTVQDLLFHFPLRYEDRSRLIPLRDLTGGQKGTYWGVVVQVQELRPRPRLTLLKVLLD